MLGIYIHIPFCARKCDYCDFYSIPVRREDVPCSEYLRAVETQLRADAVAHGLAGHRVGSIYFGGGTPSLMSVSFFEKILDELAKIFSFEGGIEISCETNPATVDLEWFREIRACGVTRAVIGVQTFCESLLPVLGRIHTGGDAMRAVAEAEETGFNSVGVDLIFGIPGETAANLEDDMKTALMFQPQHISAYQLTVEDGTPIAGRIAEGDLKMPGEDESLRQMRIASRILARSGHRRYEISNFARSGFECAHNINYWRYGEYLGLGAAATSFMKVKASDIHARRWTCVRDVHRYIHGEAPEAEDIRVPTAMSEFCFMGLRMADGISRADFRREFGAEFDSVYPDERARLVGEGLIQDDGERLSLTDRGVELSNCVFEEFIPTPR